MIDISREKVERARVKAEKYYKSIIPVPCPYFNGERIAFNARGLEHIKFKDVRQARPSKDQYIRFRLLELAPEILKMSRTLQGLSHRKNMERLRTHGKWTHELKVVSYYEFTAVIKEKTRVRVIVKQIENGQKFFWSIIPFWKMSKTGGKLLYDGKPEID